MKSASSNIHPRLDVQILAEVHSGGIGAKSASTGDAAACQSCRAVQSSTSRAKSNQVGATDFHRAAKWQRWYCIGLTHLWHHQKAQDRSFACLHLFTIYFISFPFVLACSGSFARPDFNGKDSFLVNHLWASNVLCEMKILTLEMGTVPQGPSDAWESHRGCTLHHIDVTSSEKRCVPRARVKTVPFQSVDTLIIFSKHTSHSWSTQTLIESPCCDVYSALLRLHWQRLLLQVFESDAFVPHSRPLRQRLGKCHVRLVCGLHPRIQRPGQADRVVGFWHGQLVFCCAYDASRHCGGMAWEWHENVRHLLKHFETSWDLLARVTCRPVWVLQPKRYALQWHPSRLASPPAILVRPVLVSVSSATVLQHWFQSWLTRWSSFSSVWWCQLMQCQRAARIESGSC